MSKKKPQFGLAVSAALLVVSGLIQMSFTSDGVRLGYMADSHGKTPSAAAVAHAAGEFRIVAANVIWMKIIDHYHHQYLAQGGD